WTSGRCSFYSALCQHLRQVPLVFGAAAQVARRIEALDSLLGSIARRSAGCERLLDGLRAYCRWSGVGDPDAPLTVFHPLSRGADDGPVRHSPSELFVAVRSRRHGEADIDDQLVRREWRREHTLEEIARGDAA